MMHERGLLTPSLPARPLRGMGVPLLLSKCREVPSPQLRPQRAPAELAGTSSMPLARVQPQPRDRPGCGICVGGPAAHRTLVPTSHSRTENHGTQGNPKRVLGTSAHWRRHRSLPPEPQRCPGTCTVPRALLAVRHWHTGSATWGRTGSWSSQKTLQPLGHSQNPTVHTASPTRETSRLARDMGLSAEGILLQPQDFLGPTSSLAQGCTPNASLVWQLTNGSNHCLTGFWGSSKLIEVTVAPVPVTCAHISTRVCLGQGGVCMW